MREGCRGKGKIDGHRQAASFINYNTESKVSNGVCHPPPSTHDVRDDTASGAPSDASSLLSQPLPPKLILALAFSPSVHTYIDTKSGLVRSGPENERMNEWHWPD